MFPNLITTVLSITQEKTMLDIKNIKAKKTVKRKKHHCIVNVLKECVGAITITKCILDLGINLIIDKLLDSELVFKKQLTKAISEDKVIQSCANTLKASNDLKVRKSCTYYSMGSSKAKVRLKDKSKVNILFDTDAEINIIIRKVMGYAGLAM